MPPDQYAQAAQEALAKLSPEERAEFLKMLQERAAARGVKLQEMWQPIRRTWERCSPICMRSPVSFGTSATAILPVGQAAA